MKEEYNVKIWRRNRRMSYDNGKREDIERSN